MINKKELRTTLCIMNACVSLPMDTKKLINSTITNTTHKTILIYVTPKKPTAVQVAILDDVVYNEETMFVRGIITIDPSEEQLKLLRSDILKEFLLEGQVVDFYTNEYASVVTNMLTTIKNVIQRITELASSLGITSNTTITTEIVIPQEPLKVRWTMRAVVLGLLTYIIVTIPYNTPIISEVIPSLLGMLILIIYELPVPMLEITDPLQNKEIKKQ